MFSQYFGNYLLNKGTLTAQQLGKALEYSQSTQVKLGVMAMNAGLMNAGQVEEVQQLQKTMDKRFGEIAVIKGYLTDAQVDDLLKAQNKGHIVLGQTLIDLDYLSLQQLEDEMQKYKKDSGLTSEQFDAVKLGDVDGIVRAFIDFSGTPEADYFYDYIALTLRNFIRFAGQSPRIDRSSSSYSIKADNFICQSFAGKPGIFTGLAMSDEVLIKMGARYSGMNIVTRSELAVASVEEFLNVNNGLFAVNMSNRGVELELQPPVIKIDTEIGRDVFPVACHLDFGLLYIVIANKSTI